VCRYAAYDNPFLHPIAVWSARDSEVPRGIRTENADPTPYAPAFDVQK
jgi:hypothetical protein